MWLNLKILIIKIIVLMIKSFNKKLGLECENLYLHDLLKTSEKYITMDKYNTEYIFLTIHIFFQRLLYRDFVKFTKAYTRRKHLQLLKINKGFIIKNNFEQVLQQLNEVVEITKTNFGDNIPYCNNSKIRIEDEYIITKFIYEGYIITVYFKQDDSSIGFGVEDSSNITSSHEESNFNINNMYELYGRILYVMYIILNKYNIKKFCFYAASTEPRLKRLYRSFIKFKKLEVLMNQIGFTYQTTKSNKFKSIFKPVPEEEYWFIRK